jgi:uncharacterized protein (DUF433 family)
MRPPPLTAHGRDVRIIQRGWSAARDEAAGRLDPWPTDLRGRHGEWPSKGWIFGEGILEVTNAAAHRFASWDHERMTEAQVLERIAVDPVVCGGKPCIRGHRIWVSLILGMLAEGLTIAEILDDYPQLDDADIRACIAYGALLANGRFVDV